MRYSLFRLATSAAIVYFNLIGAAHILICVCFEVHPCVEVAGGGREEHIAFDVAAYSEVAANRVNAGEPLRRLVCWGALGRRSLANVRVQIVETHSVAWEK